MRFGVLLDSIFGGERWVSLFFSVFFFKDSCCYKDVFKQVLNGGTQDYMLVFSRTHNSFMLLHSFFIFTLFIYFLPVLSKK